MKKKWFVCWLLVYMTAFADVAVPADPEIFLSDDVAESKVFNFAFSGGAEGWVGGFADYPVGEEDFYSLAWDWQALPVPLNENGSSLYVAGDNLSDDLFMFIKKRLDGLNPKTRYALTFTVTFATNAPTGCAGVGGGPDDVWMKAAASVSEPNPVVSGTSFRMNIDKGNQANGGTDAVMIGDISSTITDCGSETYELKVLGNQGSPFEITSDSNGSVWVLIGTDSGFEGTTSLYYSNIDVRAMKIVPGNRAPERPILSLPENGEIIRTLSPMLRTDPFFDPDEEDVHAQTAWQISKDPGFSSYILDETSEGQLTSFYVADAILKADATYYWRVRFQDNHHADSEWSDVCQFSTFKLDSGYLVTSDLWIRAVIHTLEKGPIEAIWKKGGEDMTEAEDRVISGHFYANPDEVNWGSPQNPDIFVKIWFDRNGRLDVNFFHVSVPDIDVWSDYPFDWDPDEYGTTTLDTRYVRHYYENGQSETNNLPLP